MDNRRCTDSISPTPTILLCPIPTTPIFPPGVERSIVRDTDTRASLRLCRTVPKHLIDWYYQYIEYRYYREGAPYSFLTIPFFHSNVPHHINNDFAGPQDHRSHQHQERRRCSIYVIGILSSSFRRRCDGTSNQ